MFEKHINTTHLLAVLNICVKVYRKFTGFFLRGHGSSVDSCATGNHTSAHAPSYGHVVCIAQFSSTVTKADNNMDAAVAGKRKHFDTDEDASNRKVISSLTSHQILIPSN